MELYLWGSRKSSSSQWQAIYCDSKRPTVARLLTLQFVKNWHPCAVMVHDNPLYTRKNRVYFLDYKQMKLNISKLKKKSSSIMPIRFSSSTFLHFWGALDPKKVTIPTNLPWHFSGTSCLNKLKDTSSHRCILRIPRAHNFELRRNWGIRILSATIPWKF